MRKLIIFLSLSFLMFPASLVLAQNCTFKTRSFEKICSIIYQAVRRENYKNGIFEYQDVVNSLNRDLNTKKESRFHMPNTTYVSPPTYFVYIDWNGWKMKVSHEFYDGFYSITSNNPEDCLGN